MKRQRRVEVWHTRELIHLLSERSEEDGRKPNPMNIMKLKGLIKTKNRVHWSEEVDQAVYGAG